jgi:hypothetical protein
MGLTFVSVLGWGGGLANFLLFLSLLIVCLCK